LFLPLRKLREPWRTQKEEKEQTNISLLAIDLLMGRMVKRTPKYHQSAKQSSGTSKKTSLLPSLQKNP